MLAKKSLRVLSCVPKQLYSFSDKLQWVEHQMEQHHPDVVVCPQEWAGGIQVFLFADQIKERASQPGVTPEKLSYAPTEVTGPYTALAKKHQVGIIVGAVVDDPDLKQRRERVFVIDPADSVTGYVDKMMLPAYDHVAAKGRTRIYPENDFERRAQAFPLCGSRVSILFCWEFGSSFLWHAISRAQPDWVASCIKFGVNGYPQKAKVDGESVVTGFGYGPDGGWIERLRMAARWDLAAPIVCSTNSWNLPKKSGALAGQILPWEEKETTPDDSGPRPGRKDTLWVSEGKGDLDEDHVQVDQVDFGYWRYARENKFTMHEAIEEWPRSEARAFTMTWKVRRMERAFCGLPRLAAEASK